MCTLDIFYLLSQLFDHISIVKLVSSRPATGEVYVVCEGFRRDVTAQFRGKLVDAIWGVLGTTSTFTSDPIFHFNDTRSLSRIFKYVLQSNECHIKYQLYSCYRILEEYDWEVSRDGVDSVVKDPECDYQLLHEYKRTMGNIRQSLTDVRTYCDIKMASNGCDGDSNVNCPDLPPQKKRKLPEVALHLSSEAGMKEGGNACECEDSWRAPYESSYGTIRASDYFEYWRLYDLQEF